MLTSESESEADNSPKLPRKSQKFPYPECWKNNERMDRLFAPYRVRSVNPESYDIKIAFWKDMICRYCEFNGSPNFSKFELLKAFERKGKVPYDLDTVINHSIQNKEIRKRTEYMYDPLNSWTGWAVNQFLKKPIFWGVDKMIPKNADNESYTQLDIANKMSRSLLDLLAQHPGKVVKLKALKTFLSADGLKLNDDGLCLCLHTLECEKHVFVEYEVHNGAKIPKFIKIPKSGEQASPIEKTDLAIFELEDAQSKLISQIEQIENSIHDNDTLVRKYVKEGKKQMAKSYLRKKHLAEKKHEMLNKSLNNLETSLMSIEQAHANKEIIEAYKVATTAMKKSQPDIDEVEDIMNSMQDTMDENKEIQDTLGRSAIVEDIAEDMNLEEELAELMGEVEEAEQLKNRMDKEKVHNVQLTDEELINLLSGLEVEENSPKKVEEQNFKIEI